ncbi:hypothetical protein [Vibrio aerogenes]|uniref:hypothetical protein n=1 Tax=Vibrio aerogenes TaxID=92172 RepID=UPI0011147883|nr:hypothetical protein [Vibrio aerogenes]
MSDFIEWFVFQAWLIGFLANSNHIFLIAEYESAVVLLFQISQKYFGLAPQTVKGKSGIMP